MARGRAVGGRQVGREDSAAGVAGFGGRLSGSGVAGCPSARGRIVLPCVWQALRGVRPTSGASGGVVLQPRGRRRADSPHQQLRAGERGGGARTGASPWPPTPGPTLLPPVACLAFLIPSSCLPEAPGNHPRGRVPQAGGGGRRMLRVPVPIFPGHRDQARRQASRKGRRGGWVLRVCGRERETCVWFKVRLYSKCKRCAQDA